MQEPQFNPVGCNHFHIDCPCETTRCQCQLPGGPVSAYYWFWISSCLTGQSFLIKWGKDLFIQWCFPSSISYIWFSQNRNKPWFSFHWLHVLLVYLQQYLTNYKEMGTGVSGDFSVFPDLSFSVPLWGWFSVILMVWEYSNLTLDLHVVLKVLHSNTRSSN